MKTAIILGASGLIGQELLFQLLGHPAFKEVIAVVRKPLVISSPKLKQLIVDFSHLEDYQNEIKGDYVFCCIGSTMKKAKTKENYTLIDRIYPREIGKIALANGARHYILVSAMGANPKSPIFYNRLKGLTETDICHLGYDSVSIMKPSLLVGNRTENRPLEHISIQIMKWVNPLLTGKLKKFRSIQANNVANAMIKAALLDKKGCSVYESDQLQELSEREF